MADAGKRASDMGKNIVLILVVGIITVWVTAAAIGIAMMMNVKSTLEQFNRSCRTGAPPNLGNGQNFNTQPLNIYTNQKDSAMSLSNQAAELLQQNKNAEALEVCQKAVTLDPGLVPARINFAYALARLGQRDLAIANLKDAVQMDPKCSKAWWNLATTYQSSGQTAEALKTYKIALASFPNDPEAAQARNIVDLLGKEQEEAPMNKSVSPRAEDYFGDVTHKGVFKWAPDRMPLRVYVDPGNNVFNLDKSFPNTAQSAFLEWLKVCGAIKVVFVDHDDNADITLRWTDDVHNVSQPAEGGETRVYPGPNGIKKARIMVVTKAPGGEPVNGPMARVICLHEVGHALGLMGHSSNANDVMFASAPLAYEGKRLTRRDCRTLEYLYEGDVKPSGAGTTFNWGKVFGGSR